MLRNQLPIACALVFILGGAALAEDGVSDGKIVLVKSLHCPGRPRI